MKTIILVLFAFTGVSVFAQTTDVLQPVLSLYLSVKTSLIKDDSKQAQEDAKALVAAIEKMETDKLSGAQASAWKKYSQKALTDAGQIQTSGDIALQREHFISLSKNMYSLVKAFGTNTTEIYYQFCPMANDGKGAYWLSEESKVVNPYFGAQMLHCGSTKEIIKPKL